MAWLFINGIGVWGVDIPVAWGFAIAEYVWWIALASGGTIVSALFYLTRSPWRSATNRIAETMMLCAAACAGIMPIMHLGRPGFFYWLFPYPNVMGVWPQVRSPLWWDFVCLLCYILMSVMFYYVGLLPDLATVRDLARRSRASRSFTASWRSAGAARRGTGATTGPSICIMAAIMAPMVISVHSVVGLDFAGGLTPGWHSTQFPPYFFFGAVISGHRAGHHADDPGAPRLRLAEHHHRLSPQCARPRSCWSAADARLLPMSGRRSGRSTAATSPSAPSSSTRIFGLYAPAYLGEDHPQHRHPAAAVAAGRSAAARFCCS